MTEKAKIQFEDSLPLEMCIEHLESIVAGLRAGKVRFALGARAVELHPADTIHAEIKAKRKSEEGSLAVSFTWKRTAMQEPQVLVADGGRGQRTHAGKADAAPQAARVQGVSALEEQVASQGHETQCSEAQVRVLLQNLTREELYEKAQVLELEGRSQMTKDELVTALCEEATVDDLFSLRELYAWARSQDIPGRSAMGKEELVEALSTP